MSEEKQVKVSIDGIEVSVPAGNTIIKAAEKCDTYIPHFCYHSGLSVVGQCRMCFVEIEGAPKLATACSTPVAEGMKILTASEKVKAGQNATLEFTLLNHPLDCPICDRGGECKLQDYTYDYGPPLSRMQDEKLHKDKHRPISEKVVLDQERCIVCTRCTRFSAEVDGRTELVITQRGSSDVIDVFDNRPVTSGFQGNVVDLCPVGALTATDYRFAARPWELKKHEAICTGCSVGCNVEIHTKHRHTGITRPDGTLPIPEILRLIPRENQNVNTWWMCDKGRWGYHFSNDTATRLIEAQAKRSKDEALAPMSLREIQMLLEEYSKTGGTWDFWISDNFPHEGIAWAKELANSWQSRGRKINFFNSNEFGRNFVEWYGSRLSNPVFSGQVDWSKIKKIVSPYSYRELEEIVPILSLKLGQAVRQEKIEWQILPEDKIYSQHATDNSTIFLVDPPRTQEQLAQLKKSDVSMPLFFLWRSANSRGLLNEGICPTEILSKSLENTKPNGAVFYFGQTTQNPMDEKLFNYLSKANFLIVTDSFSMPSKNKKSLTDFANVVLPLTPLYESQSTLTSVENYRQVSKGIHIESPNMPNIRRGGPLVSPSLKLI